jgi:hypothetical protein
MSQVVFEVATNELRLWNTEDGEQNCVPNLWTYRLRRDREVTADTSANGVAIHERDGLHGTRDPARLS